MRYNLQVLNLLEALLALDSPSTPREETVSTSEEESQADAAVSKLVSESLTIAFVSEVLLVSL